MDFPPRCTLTEDRRTVSPPLCTPAQGQGMDSPPLCTPAQDKSLGTPWESVCRVRPLRATFIMTILDLAPKFPTM